MEERQLDLPQRLDGPQEDSEVGDGVEGTGEDEEGFDVQAFGVREVRVPETGDGAVVRDRRREFFFSL